MSVFRPRIMMGGGSRFFLTDPAERELYRGGALRQEGAVPQRETGGSGEGQQGEAAAGGWRSRLSAVRMPGLGGRRAGRVQQHGAVEQTDATTLGELEAGTRI